jgi:seryl-tRNA synthetase
MAKKPQTKNPQEQMEELDQKLNELRDERRAANETLQDLRTERREIVELIRTGFHGQLKHHLNETKAALDPKLGELFDHLKKVADECRAKLLERWGYIEHSLAADPEFARLIALHVLQEAPEGVKTQDSTWHLVKETPQEDGQSLWALGPLARRAGKDPEVQKALMAAVVEFRPNFRAFPVFMEGVRRPPTVD